MKRRQTHLMKDIITIISKDQRTILSKEQISYFIYNRIKNTVKIKYIFGNLLKNLVNDSCKQKIVANTLPQEQQDGLEVKMKFFYFKISSKNFKGYY